MRNRLGGGPRWRKGGGWKVRRDGPRDARMEEDRIGRRVNERELKAARTASIPAVAFKNPNPCENQCEPLVVLATNRSDNVLLFTLCPSFSILLLRPFPAIHPFHTPREPKNTLASLCGREARGLLRAASRFLRTARIKLTPSSPPPPRIDGHPDSDARRKRKVMRAALYLLSASLIGGRY